MFTMLVVDDEYYVRRGISEAIDWNDVGIQIAGEAADGEQITVDEYVIKCR